MAFKPVKVKAFLKKHENNMTYTDLRFMEEFRKFQSTFKKAVLIQTKDCNHWSTCPWAYDDCTEGPDTCGCGSIKREQEKALRIIRLYEDAARGREREHRSRCRIC